MNTKTMDADEVLDVNELAAVSPPVERAPRSLSAVCMEPPDLSQTSEDEWVVVGKVVNSSKRMTQ